MKSRRITEVEAPSESRVSKADRYLEIVYADGSAYDLSFEFLRVYSPSAEVRGHGPGQEILQVDKQDIRITRIEPVGHYAIRIVFSDNHSTGLYTWAYLRDLGENKARYWTEYLDRLSAAGYPRPD